MKTFEQLCEEHYLRIYRYVYIMTRNQELSEDITQEAFLKAYEKGGALLEHPSPEGFLCKTAKFLTYDAMRKQKRDRTEPLEYADLQKADADGAQDLFHQMQEERAAALDEDELARQIIQRLNEDEQALYRSYYIEHRSMKELAKSLGMKESAVRMRYLRLRKKIRRLVKEMHLEELVI